LVAFATALLKRAGKIVYAVLVEWSNFGKERSKTADKEISTEQDANIGSQIPLDSPEVNFSNEESFYGLCPKCGEKKMLTRWVKLTKAGNAKLYCQQCASSMKIPDSTNPIPLCEAEAAP
jgi:ssDNA-binding Zn-finger/Zn-ribbon topoisomerase 1